MVDSDSGPVIGGELHLPSVVFIHSNHSYTGVSVEKNTNKLTQISEGTLVKSVKTNIGNSFWKCQITEGKSNRFFDAVEVTSLLLKTVWESVKTETLPEFTF